MPTAPTQNFPRALALCPFPTPLPHTVRVRVLHPYYLTGCPSPLRFSVIRSAGVSHSSCHSKAREEQSISCGRNQAPLPLCALLVRVSGADSIYLREHWAVDLGASNLNFLITWRMRDYGKEVTAKSDWERIFAVSYTKHGLICRHIGKENKQTRISTDKRGKCKSR